MPGLVSVKSPPDAPPLRITVRESPLPQIPSRTPNKKPPSPFPSRSKLSPVRSTKKPPPDSPNLDDSALDNPDLGPFLLKLARDTIASGEGPAKALDYAV
ncbi:hypothetical protein F3Y22_tig00110319pilonHSYRG00396 [Hibiscus syriacus]|uniref:Uncharacterized protein n=1 Tax=Hibiscus syriacus TaxID=106335 RepID=A0A6A3B4L1_HIBSY|nr:hypothetical protein F3Y22_tig00110319pilonHSYRG00396 [Hibiscus syriacus]